MTNDQIKAIALASGFKLKEQPSGDMDLNPYVYDFARTVIQENEWLRITTAKIPNNKYRDGDWFESCKPD